ncbi:DUF1178 family protein [Prosthecomicrobium sp. N25]|uniref:DUF1178 family protein n=1 Tax=Prosthecomicrobium sp. N25 TaxID=3129254 RepID=UPI003076B8B7
MIHYSLSCEQEHAFEGWFRSSADFEAQAARRLVVCPTCGSTQVGRGLMAPNVQSGRSKDARAAAAAERSTPAAPSVPAPTAAMMVPNPVQRAMLETLREIKAKILASAEDVGPRFAEEARKIHYGEAEHRGIYGEASLDEAKALAEEGIEVHPLPILPDERN